MHKDVDVAETIIFKGVLIDFGGTLAYLDEVKNREYEAVLVATLRKLGYETSLEDIASVLVSIYANSTKGELKTLQEFWSLMLMKLKIPVRPDLTDALENVRNDYATIMWNLYDKVPATLRILQKKYRLALVSNCGVGTDKLIHSLGLADFFDCLALSYQVGVRKPDKRIYHEALRWLGLKANECVFVADEISDLEGAREIGLGTILVLQGSNTFQEAKDLNFKPDFQVNQISEVTKIL
jgi:HAD superfamily hydrolase (TIGR01509 family)